MIIIGACTGVLILFACTRRGALTSVAAMYMCSCTCCEGPEGIVFTHIQLVVDQIATSFERVHFCRSTFSPKALVTTFEPPGESIGTLYDNFEFAAARHPHVRPGSCRRGGVLPTHNRMLSQRARQRNEHTGRSSCRAENIPICLLLAGPVLGCVRSVANCRHAAQRPTVDDVALSCHCTVRKRSEIYRVRSRLAYIFISLSVDVHQHSYGPGTRAQWAHMHASSWECSTFDRIRTVQHETPPVV
jgi:hypothetical protein